MHTLSSIKQWALAKDLIKDKFEEISKSGIVILHNVSFSLAAVALLFLVAFRLNDSISLSWFFLSIAVAFTLIPILARNGYELTSKFLLLAYIDISILILSVVFGKEMLIQTFYIPACGLSILLFGKDHKELRNIGIGLAIGCYLVLDYVIFDQIYLASDETTIIKWSILGAAFITTWMTFNKFSDTRDIAEEKTQELLEETRELNKELIQKKEQLEENVRQLELAKQKVEEGSKAKTEFLSTMSHEIRTPMNAIIGMTNLLAKDNPREDQLEQLEILDFSAKTLLALINDVLDFSKIESGKIEFEEINFDLKNLMNGVVESFRFSAENKGLEMNLSISEDVPEYLVGDPARLTQILNNLVSNAVKFTEKGKVGISVRTLKSTDETVRLEFAVQDTGVGISEEKQDKIFESFTQERADTTRIFGGTGLGLTISKKLVDFQEGKMSLESTKNDGSTFFVELDFGIGESDKNEFTSLNKEALTGLENSRILLVEDNLINQKVMMRYLEKWEIDVTVANNGVEAVALMQEETFHLVLMDLQMPDMDGYEATRQIRSLGDIKRRNIPVVALTAAALKEVKEKVFASGMNDYLTKPFNPSELRNKLEHYILDSNGTGQHSVK